MRVEKITVEMLRAQAMGDKMVYELPGNRACFNGKSLCYNVQHLLECKFRCRTNYVESTLTIEKLDRNAIQ